jgi:hypothetical protein
LTPWFLGFRGFKFNATRDGYEVDEEAMRIVLRRIFYMVGVEGRTLWNS